MLKNGRLNKILEALQATQTNLLTREQEHRLARAYEGTGLGLSLVKKLTDIHGGSVSVKSKENEGCNFKVILPLIPSAAAETQKKSSQTQQPQHNSWEILQWSTIFST